MDYKWYAALAYVRANRLNHNVIEGPERPLRHHRLGQGLQRHAPGAARPRPRRRDLPAHRPAPAQGQRRLAARGDDHARLRRRACRRSWSSRRSARSSSTSSRRSSTAGAPTCGRTCSASSTSARATSAGGEWSQANPSQHWLLRAQADLTPAIIAKAIAKRLAKLGVDADIAAGMAMRIALIDAKEKSLAVATLASTGAGATGERAPWFCSGCPHNTSTKVPEGSRAVAGIGCHYMAVWMDRSTVSFSQMGGEGVSWVGQAPFTTENHIFANLGDGTYYHSGLLAVRQAIAAKVNITYKILFNDAVAMTGGQPVDGTMKVPEMTRELDAEGAAKVVVVTDEPEKYEEHDDRGAARAGVTVHHRDELDAVQKQLREIPGCTVIVYDQTCATEKRRRRKRGTMEDPAKRVVINELVCEGCGDCSVQIELPLGRAGRDRVRAQAPHQPEHLQQGLLVPEGLLPELHHGRGRPAEEREEGRPSSGRRSRAPCSAARAGAAGGREALGHRRRRRRRHRRHHDRPAARHGRAPRGQGHRHAGLGRPGAKGRRDLEPHPDRQPARGDPLDQGRHRRGRPRDRLRPDRRRQQGDARRDARRPHLRRAQHPRDADRGVRQQPRLAVPGRQLRARRSTRPGPDHVGSVDADTLAVQLLGDSIYTNPLMLGYAWQQGRVPLGHAALMRAIELNGVQVENNKAAFEWGRRAAHEPQGGEGAGPHRPGDRARQARDQPRRHDRQARRVPDRLPERGLRGAVQALRRQGAREGGRGRVLAIATRPDASRPSTKLTEAVARYLFKLMAYKDEYEVARLHSRHAASWPRSRRSSRASWARTTSSPTTSRRRRSPRRNAKGELQKQRFGPWMLSAFRVLAKLKGLRGTPFDPFGRSEERRAERALIDEYRESIEEVLRAPRPGQPGAGDRDRARSRR